MSFHQRLLSISFLARNLGHKIKIANELITLQNLDYQQKYWKGRLRSNGKLVAISLKSAAMQFLNVLP